MRSYKKSVLFMTLFTLFSVQIYAQEWKEVSVPGRITHVQPMTGLVLWKDQARQLNSKYGQTIQLEFAYLLPNKVVKGCKQDGTIQYDWTSFEALLNDIASRKHQAVIRVRYENPDNDEVNASVKGSTAVPEYIKKRGDYHETFHKNGDGPTYYADWRNAELKRFTLQFYTDLAERYAHDRRLAFLETGFGHWSEYHIYGTEYKLGVNFPDMEFQTRFIQHLNKVLNGRIEWGISIDAASKDHSPVSNNAALMQAGFGLFDDSFMSSVHEIGSGDGYSEQKWQRIASNNRWKKDFAGGEIAYSSHNEQQNFLNPTGMYGHTWEDMAKKYHITFMLANNAPGSRYAQPARFMQASLATGYRFAIKKCESNGRATRVTITNKGVAPFYYDAWLTIGEKRSSVSLKNLLPGEERVVEIPDVTTSTKRLTIVSDRILPSQEIEFEGFTASNDPTGIESVENSGSSEQGAAYTIDGKKITDPYYKGLVIKRGRKYMQR